jgi:anti-sigma B factor antagonist
MEIKTEKNEEYAIIRLKGELDANTAIETDQCFQDLFKEGSINFMIDGKELSYISSAGIGVFIAYLEDIKQRGGSLSFFSLNENVFSVMNMLGVDQLVKVYKDEKAAKSSIVES